MHLISHITIMTAYNKLKKECDMLKQQARTNEVVGSSASTNSGCNTPSKFGAPSTPGFSGFGPTPSPFDASSFGAFSMGVDSSKTGTKIVKVKNRMKK